MLNGSHSIYEKRGSVGVLLAHGITGAPTEMKPLVRKLAARGFTVACPQLAGHCSSIADLKRTGWKDWYASLASALDALRTECDTVFVSGLSMGALLALKLASDRPESIAGIATLSATFFYDGWNVPQLAQRLILPVVIYSPLRHFLSYRERPPFGIKDERLRNLIAAVYESGSGDTTGKYGYPEFPGDTIRETFGLIRAVKRDLAAVVAPLLIVHATEDDMATVANARYLAANVSSAQIDTFLVNDSYHVLTLDKRKDEVANRVADFFSSIARPNAVQLEQAETSQ